MEKQEIHFATRDEAAAVLSKLQELLTQRGVVYKADLYNLIGFEPTYVANKWGWVDLADARLTHVGDSWKIHFPEIKELIKDPLLEKAVQFIVHGHPDFPDGKIVDTYQEVTDLVAEIKSYDFVCQTFVIKREVIYAWTR